MNVNFVLFSRDVTGKGIVGVANHLELAKVFGAVNGQPFVGAFDVFPERHQVPEDTLVYDREWRGGLWYMLDITPLHIDSVPKETRLAQLLMS